MSVDAISWKELPEFKGKHVLIYGLGKDAVALVNHIKETYPDIVIDGLIQKDTLIEKMLNLRVYSLEEARSRHILDGANLLIADNPMGTSNLFIEDNPAEIRYVSTALERIFHTPTERVVKAEKCVTPFYTERGTPPIKALVSNAYISGGPAGQNIFELADFEKQEYVTWTMPSPDCDLSLREFCKEVRPDTLPMRMSHLSYILWKRGVHVTQLSPSKKWFIGVRYNYFFLDILNTETGEVIRWHDLPPSDGLWDYVATGDFDGDKDEFLFVRWPVRDTIRGMNENTNNVHCQVCRLDLNTMRNTILYEFDFQDRIHQCTISADGRYMVFAPMRRLRPGGDPRKLKQEDIMRNLQETVVLDSMATLDLAEGKVWLTKIPFPIPAHFELDPYDPNVFYVSTHSLMPHSEGVLCFQPGTIHKMRIKNGETVVEGTYTHPGFVRTTQHCVFGWRDHAYIAATNQNKLELINAETMKLWHSFKLGDDPLYDNANFNDPEFLKKPFNLPPQPDWCDSVSASGDGSKVVLHLKDCFGIFDMESKEIVGRVRYRANLVPQFTTSHGRYWMQNAPIECINRKYGIKS